VLSKFKTGPATYKVDKPTLKQRLENVLNKTEQLSK